MDMMRRGKDYLDFPSKHFCLTVSKLFTVEPLGQNFWVTRAFMRTRGTSQFSIDNLLSHSTNKIPRATFLCFTKFLVSKNSWINRGGGNEAHDFPSRLFCLIVLKNSIGERFRV